MLRFNSEIQMLLCAAALCGTAAASPSDDVLHMGGVFGNGMVLNADDPKIHGFARPGSAVRATISRVDTNNTHADER